MEKLDSTLDTISATVDDDSVHVIDEEVVQEDNCMASLALCDERGLTSQLLTNTISQKDRRQHPRTKEIVAKGRINTSVQRRECHQCHKC